jgi:hypothetical protein
MLPLSEHYVAFDFILPGNGVRPVSEGESPDDQLELAHGPCPRVLMIIDWLPRRIDSNQSPRPRRQDGWLVTMEPSELAKSHCVRKVPSLQTKAIVSGQVIYPLNTMRIVHNADNFPTADLFALRNAVSRSTFDIG